MNNKLEIFLMHIVALFIVVSIIGLTRKFPSIGSLITYLYGMFIYKLLHTDKEI